MSPQLFCNKTVFFCFGMEVTSSESAFNFLMLVLLLLCVLLLMENEKWLYDDTARDKQRCLFSFVYKKNFRVHFSYFVLDESGSPDTTWWNNNGTVAGYIDFTNTAAAEWWYQKVKNLIDTYDIDSLKFDAGESSFTPQV